MHSINAKSHLQFDTEGQKNGAAMSTMPQAISAFKPKKFSSTEHPLTGRFQNVAAYTATSPIPRGVVSWDEGFLIWRDFVPGRARSTSHATQTHWNELRRFAAENGIDAPCDVTPDLMRKFVEQMQRRGLAAATLNARLAKIKSLFRILAGKGLIKNNPATDTLGLRESGLARHQKRHLPFDESVLAKFFSSQVFNEQQLRAGGQIGEASYWIPILMFYTGARTEEVAGLALADVVQDARFGGYINFVGRTANEHDFSGEGAWSRSTLPVECQTEAPWRALKNPRSERRVPMAPQLVELGLLRYLDWRREQESQWLFPELAHDGYGKHSGALSKFFSRYKKTILDIDIPRQVLLSLRVSMVYAMARALMPSNFQQRILGNACGRDLASHCFGHMNIPLDALMNEFKKIEFLPIPAQPWMPGKGTVKYPKPDKAKKE